jgi:DNA-binding transcriptional regulator YdaS (Cro superfamily)
MTRKAPKANGTKRKAQRVVSLHRYLRALSRAAGYGEALHAQQEFAKRCHASLQYLNQLALGIRRATPGVAIDIERASYGVIKAEESCPRFDWMYAKTRDTREEEAKRMAARSRAATRKERNRDSTNASP